jgi:hypothetical protein
MAYLHLPRLIFAGDFLCDVSTINNDMAHYNNQTFQPSFQEFGDHYNNGWWNPEGGATFNFRDCIVTKMVLPDGSEVEQEAATTLFVKGAEGRTTGKMVDIDPQQQGCSELWGVRLRIVTQSGVLVLEGKIFPAAFRDLQWRQYNGIQENKQPLGATWTTVLEDLVWGEAADSYSFFDALKKATQENRLSVNLNLFGYHKRHASNGRFTLGRIIGTIGPWYQNEPLTFAPVRRLYGVVNMGTTAQPQVFFGSSNFLVEKEEKRLTLDLGSCFPIADAMGRITFNQPLFLAVSQQGLTNGINTTRIKITPVDFLKNFTLVAPVLYRQDDQWLNQTGGIFTLSLPDAVLDLLAGINKAGPYQLVLLAGDEKGELVLIARESIGGYYVRPDNFVQRLDNGDTSEIDFYAYQWGQPLSLARVNVQLLPPTPDVPQGPDNPISYLPGNNFPAEGITYDPIVSILNGKGTMRLQANKIENPRGYVDGQMYFVDYELQGVGPDPAVGIYTPEVISIHLRSDFKEAAEPVWEEIQDIMTQFANLYPIMSKYLVNLKDPHQVMAKKDILTFAFSLDFRDPAYMPVSRDLSEAKRRTILKWLYQSKPLFSDDQGSWQPGRRSLQSPADPSQSPVEKIKKLKQAMLMKGGAIADFPSIEVLKF